MYLITMENAIGPVSNFAVTTTITFICYLLGCFPKWARYENTAGLGGQSFTNNYVNDFSDCLEACFDQTDCIGIEWTGFPGSNATCTYYSTSQQSAMTSTSLKPFVTQYRLTDRCGRCKQSPKTRN